MSEIDKRESDDQMVRDWAKDYDRAERLEQRLQSLQAAVQAEVERIRRPPRSFCAAIADRLEALLQEETKNDA